MVDRIPPPRVTLEVEIEQASPTVAAPLLLPCAVGPAFYVVEAFDSDGGLNTQARVSFKAVLVATYAGPYNNLGGKGFKVGVLPTNMTEVIFPATVPNPSAEYAASVINSANIPGIRAGVVRDSGAEFLAVYNTSTSAATQIFVDDPDTVSSALPILGFEYRQDFNFSDYNRLVADIPLNLLPDPKDLLDQVTIKTLRAFLRRGSSTTQELKSDEAFYRYEAYARAEGTVDLTALSYPDDVIDKQLSITTWPGGTSKTLTFFQTIRAGLIDLINEMVQDYMNHKNDQPGPYHAAPDTQHDVTAMYPLSPNADISSIIALLNDLKAQYNAHAVDTTVHSAAGSTEATADATDWLSAITLANALKATFNAHIADGAIHPSGADGDNQVTTADAQTGDATVVLNEIQSTWPDMDVSLDGSNHLILVWLGKMFIADTDGAQTVLGATVAGKTYATATVVEWGPSGTSPVIQVNINPAIEDPLTQMPVAPAQITGTVDLTTLTYGPGGSLDGRTLKLLVDGRYFEIVFDDSLAVPSDIATAINEVVGAGTATIQANMLVLTSSYLGLDSTLWASGDAATVLGLPTDSVFGKPLDVKPGDEAWADGQKLGTIVWVTENQIGLDTEYAVGRTWDNLYFRAKNLNGYQPGRPIPELLVDGGVMEIKHNLVVDSRGQPILNWSDWYNNQVYTLNQVYVTYKGLRLDVTPEADNPSLLVFDTTDQIVEELGQPSLDNPLAFGAYMMKLAAENSQVAALGVANVTDDEPEGTVEAYQQAFEFLKDWDVYMPVPLTFKYEVLQLLKSHVAACNDKEINMRRIGAGALERPTRAAPTIVVSGTDGDAIGGSQFDTKITGLMDMLYQAGVDPAGGLTIDDGVYLDFEADGKHWLISAVSGSVVTIQTTFGPDENTDGFFSEDPFPGGLYGQSFSIIIRGQPLSSKYEEAVAYQNYGKALAGKMLIVVPDYLDTSVLGTPMTVPAYYAACYIAGLCAELHPKTPFSNMPIGAFTGATRAFPYFTKDQLNIIAGGGLFILFQEDPNSPVVKVRHQLLTDTSDVKTRELSIVRAVDFGAKYLTMILKPHAGRHNIGDSDFPIESLIDSGIKFLVEDAKVWRGAKLRSVKQSDTQIDKIEVRIEAEVFVPGNVIEIVLYI